MNRKKGRVPNIIAVILTFVVLSMNVYAASDDILFGFTDDIEGIIELTDNAGERIADEEDAEALLETLQVDDEPAWDIPEQENVESALEIAEQEKPEPALEIAEQEDAEPAQDIPDQDADLEPDLSEETTEISLNSMGDEVDTILIGSADDWEKFCTKILETNGAPVNAELTSNLTLTQEASSAGYKDIYFNGVFDGKGFTLTLDYVSDRGVAPFKEIGEATIQNLNINGTITLTKTGSDIYHSSCLVGYSHNRTFIKNCTCSAQLRYASGTSGAYGGGYIGHALYSEVFIENCIFDGTIGYVDDASSRPGLTYVSGFVPWGDNFSISMHNCVNTGSVSDAKQYYPITYTYGSSDVDNCVFIAGNTASYGPGTMAVSVSGNDTVSVEVLDAPEIVADGANYYTAPVNVSLTPVIPDGTAFWKYTINSGTLSDEEISEGTHQITGFNQNVVIGRKIKAVENSIVITNEADWEQFCQTVETSSGELLLNVELANDITLDDNSSLAGRTYETPFSGTFDGKGHTLHLNLTGDHQNVAPFVQVADAVIKNLKTDGTVTSLVSNDQCFHHSGLIGGCVGDVQIINCTVDVDLLFPSGTTRIYSGGFIGHGTRENILMEGCTFTGSIGYTDGAESKPGLLRAGGLVGWADAMRLKMKDCWNLGSFYDVAELSPLARGGTNSLQVEDCYYIADPIPNVGEYAHDCGTAMITVEADAGVKQLVVNDKPFFTSGGTAYYISPISVTLEPDIPQGKAFEQYKINDGEISDPLIASGEHVITNSKQPVKISRTLRSIDPDYVISDAADWAEFCDVVNAGTGDVIVRAVLSKDVTLEPDAPSAGTDQHPFNGEFDGQGHTLTVNYQRENGCAPFTETGEGAIIRNLHTAGTITMTGTSSRIWHASGLIGGCFGTVTIRDCVSSVSLQYVCGIEKVFSAGFIGHANSSKVVLENCVFDGSIGYVPEAENKPGLINAAGLVAWAESGSNITMDNCLNIGSFDNVANLCPILRAWGNVTVTNCYYTYTGIPIDGERIRKDGTLVAAINSKYDLAVSAVPVYSYEGIDYYSEETPLTFSFGDVHEGAFKGYTVSSGQITDPDVMEGEHKISGFTEKTVTITANWDEPTYIALSVGVFDQTNKAPGPGGSYTFHDEDTIYTSNKHRVELGSEVKLIAAPAKGFVFKGWYKGVIGSNSSVEAPTEELLTDKPEYVINADEMALCAVFECAGHQWEQKVQKATLTDDGRIYQHCSVCGAEETVAPLLKVSSITLAKTSFIYTGKPIEPEVTVANVSEKLSADQYKVTYLANTNAGTATAKITLQGDYYEGSKSLTFRINKAANPLKVKAKTAVVKYEKLAQKNQKLSVSKVIKTVSAGKGKLTYKKIKGNKKITIGKSSGKVTVKRGLKKGKYKIKVSVQAAGDANYKASALKPITIVVKIK